MAREPRINIPPVIALQAGIRLRQRRKALGISGNDLAAALQVANLTVYNWERNGFPGSVSASRMDQLESLLKVPIGWFVSDEPMERGQTSALADLPAQQIVLPVATEIEAQTLAEAIERIAFRIALTRYRNPRSEPSEVDRRNVGMFAVRYGTSGPECAMLEAIGKANGLTRERVRQITEAMTQESANFAFCLPILDALRDELQRLLPMPEREVNDTLRTILGHQLTIDDANRFCVEILGTKLVGFVDLNTGPNAHRHERVVIAPESKAEGRHWVKDVYSLALDMIRATGAAHLPTVVGQAILAGVPIGGANVIGALKVNKGFAWLVEADAWFWFGEGTPARNPMLTVAREVISAAGGRADVEDIRAGLMSTQTAWSRRDDPRLGLAVVPPIHVVRALFGQVRWLETIQSNDYCLCGDHAPYELPEAETIVFHEVMRLGGVASRSMLRDALVATGRMAFVTLSFVLETSAVFTRVTRGVVGVRGLDYPMAALQVAMETSMGKRPASTYMSNRELSFQFEMTPFAARQNVCVAPASVVPLLAEGSYNVKGTESTINMVQRASGAFALNRAVQCMVKLGIGIGELVEIGVNVQERQVSITAIRSTDEA